MLGFCHGARAAALQAGVAKVDITDYDAGPVNDPSFVKALVFRDGAKQVVIITVDAVAIGGIGRITDDYLGKVRDQLKADPGIEPGNVFVNASHCHSIVRKDTAALTVQAVREAAKRLVPVKVGAGRGREDRIMENRRLKMKDGSEVDIRRAYSMPRDEDVAAAGPVDPEIGLLRVDRMDGRPLAVIYNFACHPIQSVPSGGNTADMIGFASKVIEENLGEGVLALFVQGCAGDINPAKYKDVHQPHDAEPLGNLLGLAAMRSLRKIETRADAPLRVLNETMSLPRAEDYAKRMSAIEAEQTKLLQSLRGTSLDFKAFLPLLIQYKLSGEFPAYYSHRYLNDRALGRDDLDKLDKNTRADLEAYLRNIDTMERLTRLQTNHRLLQMHKAQTDAAGSKTIEVEIGGLRIGDFTLITFPGELTVQIGLGLKKNAPGPFTFIAGYTNGYIYYLPTDEQRQNTGYAQEDCDCLIAPGWQKLFEDKARAFMVQLAKP